MIILLDTSTPECRFGIVINDEITWHVWQANRELAKGLLAYIIEILEGRQLTLSDISGIGVFKGPGSFTGLRIGLTVMNTLADAKSIPIVGKSGETWADDACRALKGGETDKLILPDYGAEAHITKPRK